MSSPYREPARSPLGAVLVEHRLGASSAWSRATTGVAFLAFGAAVLATSFSIGLAGGVLLPMAIVGVALPALGVLRLRDAIRERRTRLVVHEHGFVLHRGGVDRAVRWDELAELRTAFAVETVTINGQVVSCIDRHVVRTIEGEEIAIDCDMRDGPEVLAALRARSEGALVDRTLAKIADGGVASFGAVAASRAGLHLVEHGVVAWDRLAEATLEGRELVLRTLDATIVLRVDDVPNAHVVPALARARLNRGGGAR